ncbi:putative disease resistance protein At1g50180 [Setaria viridis]|uniref:putative disease resistance protein At1g50180 n=1 Tax=Setaria viridis TaxID=4556 RepID=UPI003B3A7EE2
MGALPAMVLQLLNEEYKLQIGVQDNVKSLSKELESMHAALSMVARVPPEKLDARSKLWARDFREASYDMEDILDTFLVRVDGGPKPAVPGRVRRQRRQLLSKMAELFCLGKVVARHEIGTTIVGFIKDLKEMDERHGRCRVDHLAVAIPAAADDPRISDLYIEASDLVGQARR